MTCSTAMHRKASSHVHSPSMESESDKELFNSSQNGDIEGVITALAQGGRVTMRNHQGFTPLLVAAQRGHTDICGLLLASGSDVNEVDSKIKLTALHYAAAEGHNVLVEALLSWEAQVNPQDYNGFVPLHAACLGGHLLCVLTLLKAGASTTLPSNQGPLPIHFAAQRNRVEIVKTFLEHGCSPCSVGWKHKQLSSSFFISARQQDRGNATDVRSN